METAQQTVVECVTGDHPSRFKSFLAATAVGFTAATLTYRLLRRGASEDTDEGQTTAS